MRQADDGYSPLAIVHFGGVFPVLAGEACPVAVTGLAQLGAEPRIEIWRSSLPVNYGRSDAMAFSRNGTILFGCLTNEAIEGEKFEQSVYRSYLDILNLVQSQGYPHLLRVWNHFPDIARKRRGLDRYQLFCRARARAFERWFGASTRGLPSASAVGAREGALVIYFLAAARPGAQRENLRQTSAFHYPPQYGPKSPSFARATFKKWGVEDCLYISGTASIVGHESRHPDDPTAQLDEILRNLGALIESTAVQEDAPFQGLSSITHLKIYIRHAAHFAAIQRRLLERFGPAVEQLYLQADICRSDLLLEIEAIAQARRSADRRIAHVSA